MLFWLLCLIGALAFMWFVAPVKNKRRAYDREGVERKGKRAHYIILINLALFFVFYQFFPQGACCQSILVLGVALVAAAGIAENFFWELKSN